MREVFASSTFARYTVAVSAVAAAIVARLLMDPVLGTRFPFATVFFAVLLAAWYGGFGPALAATILGGLASAYFLLPPRYNLALEGIDNQGGLALYLAVGLGIALIGGAMRKARKVAERNASEAAAQREQLRVTVHSIGDAVITTDTNGRITSLNAVAVELTGWSTTDALARPLTDVFRIVNESTRARVENPVAKVLAEGKIVGLANHTVLIAKDGRERPIDDSAAPIRNEDGQLIGVVLM
jgi:PAS domain S-box-containing protein